MPQRHLIMCTDLSADSVRAVEWSIQNLYQEGDVFHIVHVALLKEERNANEVSHGPPGTAYSIHDHTNEQLSAELAGVKEFIADNVVALLTKAGIKNSTHLYLETEQAPASAVASIVGKVATETGADMIIASRSNKTWAQRWFLGSVAAELAKLPVPLVLVTTAPAAS